MKKIFILSMLLVPVMVLRYPRRLFISDRNDGTNRRKTGKCYGNELEKRNK